MPIDYSRYPKDWKATRARILKRAGQCCETCGVPNGEIVAKWPDDSFIVSTEPFSTRANSGAQFRAGARFKSGSGHWSYPAVKIVLTIAHPGEGNPPVTLDCPDNGLLALCQRCHLRRDAKMHARNSAATRAKRSLERTRDQFASAAVGSLLEEAKS